MASVGREYVMSSSKLVMRMPVLRTYLAALFRLLLGTDPIELHQMQNDV